MSDFGSVSPSDGRDVARRAPMTPCAIEAARAQARIAEAAGRGASFTRLP